MERQYKIFEVLASGSAVKIGVVPGFEFAQLYLRELAKRTSNECFVEDAETRQVVAQMNVSRTNSNAKAKDLA